MPAAQSAARAPDVAFGGEFWLDSSFTAWRRRSIFCNVRGTGGGCLRSSRYRGASMSWWKWALCAYVLCVLGLLWLINRARRWLQQPGAPERWVLADPVAGTEPGSNPDESGAGCRN